MDTGTIIVVSEIAGSSNDEFHGWGTSLLGWGTAYQTNKTRANLGVAIARAEVTIDFG